MRFLLDLPLLAALCLPLGAFAADHSIETQSELLLALEEAQAGDTVHLASGTWTDLNLVLDMEGTAEAPILITGAKDGSTVITGTSSIQIGGAYLHLENLHFYQVVPPEGAGAIIQFRIAQEDYGQNCRLSNSWLEDCNPDDPARRYRWIRLYGRGHRVDHNLFSGMAHSGQLLQFVMVEEDARHRVDHNHFLNRAQGDGNGFEIIQLGHSYHSEKDGNSIIEKNLFEACDGETEIISVKTCGNIIRENLFYRSRGTLTLRHGNRNLAERNVFLGDDKEGAGGIRIIGRDHRVVDNYFEGVSGTTGATIVIYTGIPDSPLNGYFEAHRAAVENNFIYNTHGNGIHLNGGYGVRNRILLPEDVTVANNLLHLSSNQQVQFVGELDDATLTGNIVAQGTESGQKKMDGIIYKRLNFTRQEDGLMTAADEDGNAVFEYSGKAPRLLKRSEVGPDWTTAVPKLGTWNPTQLQRLIKSDPEEIQSASAALIEEANRILSENKTYTVTSNERTGVSGDKRDYYSTGPYWWPNPETKDGLPYIRRDGEFNPERDLVSDRPILHQMVSDVTTLTLAFAQSEDQAYALHAQELLTTWFLDTTTGMRPHLSYAQAIPGRTDGRGTGIIDTLVFVNLLEALSTLELAYSWPEEDRLSLRSWFEDYLEWLTYHPNGLHEKAAINNHGTAYDLQELAIAHYLGRTEQVKHILNRVTTERIPDQITPEGEQPLEFKRTRSWSYCTENLEHFARIAAIASKYDIDLFAYESESGACLPKAIAKLVPHACDPSASWPGEQVTDWQFEYLYAALEIANGMHPRAEYTEALACLPSETFNLEKWLLRQSPIQ